MDWMSSINLNNLSRINCFDISSSFAILSKSLTFLTSLNRYSTAIEQSLWQNFDVSHRVCIPSIINLSNTTDSDSNIEIDSDVDNVVVTWWKINQTDDTPVMRVSNGNGATFGPMLTSATNGTIGEVTEGEEG